MPKGSTFNPSFEKICFFYKEFQQPFKHMQQVLPGIVFLRHSGYDITKNLPPCLHIYDDSCEKFFNVKEFLKKANSGRHRKLRVIYVKHNIFQMVQNY